MGTNIQGNLILFHNIYMKLSSIVTLGAIMECRFQATSNFSCFQCRSCCPWSHWCHILVTVTCWYIRHNRIVYSLDKAGYILSKMKNAYCRHVSRWESTERNPFLSHQLLWKTEGIMSPCRPFVRTYRWRDLILFRQIYAQLSQFSPKVSLDDRKWLGRSHLICRFIGT